MAEKSHEEIAHAFAEAVNMTPAALDKWLQTEDSKSVGWADGTNKHDSSGALRPGATTRAGASSRSSTSGRPSSPTTTTPS